MTEEFKVVIPVKYNSARFPGKPLEKINGKPMMQYVYDNAVGSGADEIIIATDNTLVGMSAEEFGATVCMTSDNHESGVDRIIEVITKYNWDEQTVVVNLHCDEPLAPASLIKQVVSNLLENAEVDCATLCTPVRSQDDINNPDIVKVVTDSADLAMYFSRSPIPYRRDAEQDSAITYYRHIGLYAYRTSLLRTFKNLPVSDLEKAERLEQLRLLWNGMSIHTAEAVEKPGPVVESSEDLEKVKAIISSGSATE